MTQPTISRVLGALPSGLDSATGLAVALQLPQPEVLEALQSLALAGLVVHAGPDDDGGWHLTPAGAEAAERGLQVSEGGFGRSVSFSFTTVRGPGHQPISPEWRQIADLAGQAFSVAREARESERESHEESLLVGDIERESALGVLSQAFGEGRLSQDEHHRRTDLVLAATTRGDLDRAVVGLTGTDVGTAGGGRRVGAAVVGLLALPVLLLALLILGSDGADSTEKLIAGLALLVLLPGLLALGWWALRPSGQRAPHWRP